MHSAKIRMASDIYTAVSLDKKRNEIRLVELLPGEDDDPISCIFHRHILRGSDFKYVALSYTWGESDSPTYKIFIDGMPFNARQNLWYFLQERRRQGRFDPIWIDAICINQSNTE